MERFGKDSRRGSKSEGNPKSQIRSEKSMRRTILTIFRLILLTGGRGLRMLGLVLR
jgi:hypothetical protein